jgi:hypothetical protein
MHYSEAYTVPDDFIFRQGKGRLLDKIKGGARVVVFSYVINLCFAAFRSVTQPIIVNPGDSVAKYKTKYIIATILLGFWLNPNGIIWSIQSINSARKGGVDITEMVKEKCLPEEYKLKPLFFNRKLRND